jgi:hypothetical protein
MRCSRPNPPVRRGNHIGKGHLLVKHGMTLQQRSKSGMIECG